MAKTTRKARELGSLELLALLAVQYLKDKAYGSAIASALTKSGVPSRPGGMHATLRRLEHKGLVKGKLGKSTPVQGGRAKRYFTLSVSGKRAVEHSVSVITKLSKG